MRKHKRPDLNSPANDSLYFHLYPSVDFFAGKLEDVNHVLWRDGHSVGGLPWEGGARAASSSCCSPSSRWDPRCSFVFMRVDSTFFVEEGIYSSCGKGSEVGDGSAFVRLACTV